MPSGLLWTLATMSDRTVPVEIVNDSADLLDVLTAVGTWGAIVVALLAAFLAPRWLERRRNPCLTVREWRRANQTMLTMRRAEDAWVPIIEVEIANAEHRHQAQDVEVFVYVGQGTIDTGGWRLEAQVPFRAGDAGGARYSAPIPAGFKRRLELGSIVKRSLRAGEHESPPLDDGDYVVVVDVVGSNFSAIRNRGELRLSRMSDAAGGPRAQWSAALRPVKLRSGDPFEQGPDPE